MFSRFPIASDRRRIARRPSGRSAHAAETLESRTLLTTIVVATDGNDATGDGSLVAPYLTLQQAVNVADPGDVIALREGTYAGGVTIYDPDITIRSYEGEWAVIQSPIDDSSIAQTIRFHFDANDGKLQNLEIVGGYYYAVKTESNWDWGVPDHERRGTSGLIIEDSKLHGSGRDVIKLTPGSDDVVIRRNEIYDSGLRYDGNAEGIDNVNADRMIVQDNYIHDIATNAVYFKGGSIGSIVERNFIENTGGAGVMMGYYTDIEWFDTTVNPDYYESIDGIVRNNIIRNTAWAGIGFYASLNPLAYNNTLVHVAQQAQAGLLTSVVEHYTSSTEFTVEANVNPQAFNNIVVLSAQSSARVAYLREGSVVGPVDFGNNLYFDEGGPTLFTSRLVDPTAYNQTLAEWQAEIGDPGSFVADPTLDAGLHLTPNSPATDNGRTINRIDV